MGSRGWQCACCVRKKKNQTALRATQKKPKTTTTQWQKERETVGKGQVRGVSEKRSGQFQ